MAAESKIYGKDLFDKTSVEAAYQRFSELNQKAIINVDLLKQAIIELNNAFKKQKLNDYNKELRKLGTELGKSKRSTNQLKTAQTSLQTKLTSSATKVNRLNTKLRQLSKTTRTVGKSTAGFSRGLGGLFSNVTGMQLGIAGLIIGTIQLGKAIFKTTKELDTMNLTLGKVTDSAYEFAKSQKFLVSVSERFGLNLLKSSKKFATFRASAKESNFTLQETMEIFETFSNAGASLGKSTADLDRIFLSLEQMMSKGRVSSEELRRQLGEVLPGAVSIMAKSMGVSNSELERMLKAGEVLAKDVIPKFAKEVKKTFSLDNTQRIETMASAQERLTNSWIKFVDSVSGVGTFLNKLFKDSLNEFTEMLNNTTKWFNDVELFLNSNLGSWEKFWLILKDSFGFDSDIDSFIKKLRDASNQKKFAISTTESIKHLETLKSKMKEFGIDFKEVDLFKDGFISPEIIDKTISGYEKLIAAHKRYLEESGSAKGQRKKATVLQYDGEDIETIKKGIKTVEELYNDSFQEILKAQIKYNEATTTAERVHWQGVIDNAQDGMKKLEGILKGFTGGGPKGKDAGETGTFNESFIAKKLGMTDEDLKKLGEKIQFGLKLAAQFNDALSEMSDAQFNNRQMQLDNERTELENYYDIKLKLSEGDADLQDKLRIQQADSAKKLDGKQKKLDYDRAKRKKAQSLIDIALNTGLGITAALTSIPPNVPLSIAIGIVGAAQLAAASLVKLPKYAKGTENHPGGGAIIGDGGKNELAISPSGGIYVSGKKAEVVNMDKGSKVIPDAQKFIQREVIKSVISIEHLNNEILVDKITDAVIKGFEKTKINNNNNITLKSGIDHSLWRNNLIHGDS